MQWHLTECTHEEADTRLILHARQLGTATLRVIRSPDTDVAVLAYCYTSQVQARLLFRIGTNARRCYVDINALAKITYGHAVYHTLHGLHTFSGCNSTSAFVGSSKKTGLHGTHSCVCDAGHVSMQLVCQLYGSKTYMQVHQ